MLPISILILVFGFSFSEFILKFFGGDYYKNTIRRANEYIQSSTPYKISKLAAENAFEDLKSGKIYSIMNAHVDDGTEPLEVAEYIDKLLTKKSWKAHYYFGKFGQKIGVPLKWILPQNFYENLMRKYNQMD